MHRLLLIALSCFLLLLLPTLAPAAAAADDSAVTTVLDLAADGKLKKATKALDGVTGDPAAGLLADLFAAYRAKDSRDILQHLWRAEDRARNVPTERIETLLTRARELRGGASSDTPLHALICHLRALHPALPNAFLPPARPKAEHTAGDVQAPRQRFFFNAPYPAELGTASGVVVTQVEIDEEGCLMGAEVTQTFSPIAERAVLDAAEWHVYNPARLGGEPVRVYYNFTSNFVAGR